MSESVCLCTYVRTQGKKKTRDTHSLPFPLPTTHSPIIPPPFLAVPPLLPAASFGDGGGDGSLACFGEEGALLLLALFRPAKKEE